MLQVEWRYNVVYTVCWSVTWFCDCSHPLFTEGELEDGFGVKRAAIRKLEHELGIPTSTFALEDLAYVSTVMYKVRDFNNMFLKDVSGRLHVYLVSTAGCVRR